MEIVHLNDSNFHTTVSASKKVVLVDFFATWCGPCSMLTSILESVNEELDGKAIVYKVDVDESPKTAHKFNVMSIPTMVLFKGGKEVSRLVGLRQKRNILEEIEKFI